MKNLFVLAVFFFMAFTSVQAQNRTFPKGKNGGDIIGKDEIRYEVVNKGSAAFFYPVDADGNAVKNLPQSIQVDVLYLGDGSSAVLHPELDNDHYTVQLDSDRIVFFYYVTGTYGGKQMQMKEQMIEYGKR